MECGSLHMTYLGGKGPAGSARESLCSGKTEKENWVQGQGPAGPAGAGLGGSWYLLVAGCRAPRYLGTLPVVEVRPEPGSSWRQRRRSSGCRWTTIGTVVGDAPL